MQAYFSELTFMAAQMTSLDPGTLKTKDPLAPSPIIVKETINTARLRLSLIMYRTLERDGESAYDNKCHLAT